MTVKKVRLYTIATGASFLNLRTAINALIAAATSEPLENPVAQVNLESTTSFKIKDGLTGDILTVPADQIRYFPAQNALDSLSVQSVSGGAEFVYVTIFTDPS